MLLPHNSFPGVYKNDQYSGDCCTAYPVKYCSSNDKCEESNDDGANKGLVVEAQEGEIECRLGYTSGIVNAYIFTCSPRYFLM